MHRLTGLVLAAVAAPSVHNTQPWIFATRPGHMSMRADRRRQLAVLDPTGRQLVLSCGCALFNFRVAAAAAGFVTRVERFPETGDPDLLARVDVQVDPAGADTDLAALAPALRKRQTNRRRFERDPVPPALLAQLHRSVAAEGAALIDIVDGEHRRVVAELSRLADEAQTRDPHYLAEIRAWTSDDPLRLDGVAARTVPHVSNESGDEIPIRDFDTRGRGALPGRTESTTSQDLVLLCSDADEPVAWLRAGEALEHALLDITAAGWTASPMTQVVEVPAAREQLRAALGLTGYPLVLLRIGKAAPTAGSPRRRVADVIVDDS